MTTEEKAKAYDEALERARKINSGEGVAAPPDWTTCEVIFPQLRESEDERIRKFILEVIKAYDGMSNSSKEKCISYLEKQKEQKSLEYLPKEKVYHIMHELGKLSLSDIIPIESKEYRKIDEITSDVRDLLDYPIKQKQEWSEEDEKKRNLLIDILEVNHPNGYFKVNPANTLNMEAMHVEELVDWLKSLRFQPKKELSIEKAIKWLDDNFYFLDNSSGRGKDCEITTHAFDSLKEMYDSFRKAVIVDSKPQSEIYQAAKHDLAIKFMNYLDENCPEGKMCLSNGECEDIDKAFKENDWAKIIRYAEKYQIQPEKLTWEDAQNLWIISRQVGNELDSAKDTFPKWGSSSREMFEEILRRFYKKKEK